MNRLLLIIECAVKAPNDLEAFVLAERTSVIEEIRRLAFNVKHARLVFNIDFSNFSSDFIHKFLRTKLQLQKSLIESVNEILCNRTP